MLDPLAGCAIVTTGVFTLVGGVGVGVGIRVGVGVGVGLKVGVGALPEATSEVPAQSPISPALPSFASDVTNLRSFLPARLISIF